MNTWNKKIEDEERPEPLTDYELHDMYDSMLDECYEDVKIAGLEYTTSNALKNVDETAYRCGFSDWLDSECQNEILKEEDGEYYLADAY